MRTSAVIFKHTPTYVSPNERIGKASEFLFGGPMMSLVTVDPLEASSLETLSADDLEDGAFNTAVHAAETLLVNMRTQEAPALGDLWVAEAQWWDVFSLAACSPLGDRMLLRNWAQKEDGGLQTCARLLIF